MHDHPDAPRAPARKEPQATLSPAAPTAGQASSPLGGLLVQLQAAAGNRAVTGLVARRSVQREADPWGGDAGADSGVDAKMRVQQLRLAIRFEPFPPHYEIDRRAVTDAFQGLTREDGRRIKSLYREREKAELVDVLNAEREIGDGFKVPNNLSAADRVQLITLLAGTAKPVEMAPAAEATGEMLGAALETLGTLTGRAEEAKAVTKIVRGTVGSRVSEGLRRADKEATDSARKRKSRADAAAFRAAVDRNDVETALGFLKRPKAGRDILSEAYQTAFNEPIMVAVTIRLTGNATLRALALLGGDLALADRLALDKDVAESEKFGAAAKETGGMMGMVYEVRQKEAKKKIEARIEAISSTGDQTTSAGRALGKKHLANVLGGSAGSGDIRARMGVEGDAVLKAIIDGDAAEELGAKLARKDTEGTVTPADVEAALRELGSMVPPSGQKDAAVDGTFEAFQAAFNKNNKKRTLAEVLAGQPKTMADMMAVVGVDQADLQRNRALFERKGSLPEWQELFFALNRDPKNLARVREILGAKKKSEVDELALTYTMHTGGRSLKADLIGADPAMVEAINMFGGEAREALAERQELLEGGEFESKEEDPVKRMAEEGAWLHGRIMALEKRVMDNRGLFAELRDWSGNVEHELVGLAKSDANAAKKELDRALGASPPEVSVAQQQIRELRRTKRRLTHAVEAYKESTKKAFAEFVNMAVMVVATAATLGKGGFIIMALRSTAAQIGTKLVLKADDYSADEFLDDLRGGLMDMAAGGVVEKLYKPLAASWAKKAVDAGLDKTLAGRVAAKVGPIADWEMEEQIENLITSGEFMGVEEHVTAVGQEGLRGGMKVGVDAAKRLTGGRGEAGGKAGAGTEAGQPRSDPSSEPTESGGQPGGDANQPTPPTGADAAASGVPLKGDEGSTVGGGGGSAPTRRAGRTSDRGGGDISTPRRAGAGGDAAGGGRRPPPVDSGGPTPGESGGSSAYEAGMPEQSMATLKRAAQEYGIVIDVRPPGFHTRGRLAQGAMPKPANIKAKTISEVDVQLGAPAGSVGLVGYFEPVLPIRPADMSDADWDPIAERFADRKEEFATLADDMRMLSDEGTINVVDGIVHALDPNAPKEGPARYRAVAGDVDIYQIRWADPDREMSNAEADFFAEQLRGMGIGVQHPAHRRWDPKTEKDIKIQSDIDASHAPGGKPLLRFEPDANPSRVDNTTPITRRARKQARITDATPEPGTPGYGGKRMPDIGADIEPGSDWQPGMGPDPKTLEGALPGSEPAAGFEPTIGSTPLVGVGTEAELGESVAWLKDVVPDAQSTPLRDEGDRPPTVATPEERRRTLIEHERAKQDLRRIDAMGYPKNDLSRRIAEAELKRARQAFWDAHERWPEEPPPIHGALPAETVIQFANAKGGHEYRKAFDEMVAKEPYREVGLFQNRDTGEWILIQGRSDFVAADVDAESGTATGPNAAGSNQRWKELLDKKGGSWILVHHSHPADPATGFVRPQDTFPSSGTGDFGVIVSESSRAGWVPRVSKISYMTKDGLQVTSFGFDPRADKPYWVQRPGEEKQQFKSLRDYEKFMRKRFPKAGFDPIPEWMPVGPVPEAELGADEAEEGPSRQLDAGVPRANTLGAATLDEVRTEDEVGRGPAQQGAAGPSAGPADAGRDMTPDSDLTREGRPGPTIATRQHYDLRPSSRYEEVGTTSGSTGGRILIDRLTGQKYLFKPISQETTPERATDRGIVRGSLSQRAVAGELAANALDLPTPHVELVQIGREKGSLTEWWDHQSLGDFAKNDPGGFAILRQTPEFRHAMARIDALDYLINQVDRVQNLGNYLIVFDEHGRFKDLYPIDNELAFTSTRERARVGTFARDLPATYDSDMIAKLEEINANREDFARTIGALVGPEAVPGILQRLDKLLNHARSKGATELRPERRQPAAATP